MNNYLQRIIKKPNNLKNELYIYDYRTIKNFQRNSGLKDFAATLYLALIAEIVFLFFSLKYTEEYKYDELIVLLQTMESYLSINLLIKLYYLPIAFTIAFIIWRAKNYLSYELTIDIETKFDKALELLIPITFSIIVYFIFNIHYYKFWMLLCSLCFFITMAISYIKYISSSMNNRYRKPLPKRNVMIHNYKQNNQYGYRNQLFRWSNLLLGWTALVSIVGILLPLVYEYMLVNNIIYISVLNYIIGILTCFIIHNFTFLSKSVQPICIEAYEEEIEEAINLMSFGNGTTNPNFAEKWPLLKLQYRALQHLRKKDVNNPALEDWFKKMNEELYG